MKQKRFSAEQIIKVLREAEVPGVSIGEVCRRHNITDVTFYRWRQKYGGLERSDVLKLKARRCGAGEYRSAPRAGTWGLAAE